jgi:predicted transglutaminase-like cysteine proteinase
MRQTKHLYIATAVAALAMSCVLPYATRASLYPDTTTPRVSLQTPATEFSEFANIPEDLLVSGSGGVSIDLSMFTPQGFLALSKNLNKQTEWPSINLPVVLPKPAEGSASLQNREQSVHGSAYQSDSVERIAFSKPALAPVAFVRFCMRYPDDCKPSSADLSRAPIQLTKAKWAELAKINRDVNRTIKPEENLGGVAAEEWLVAPRRGDCNDYAVTKRHELLERGWPSHSLLLTEVVIASGEHHLVVVVRTSEDDFVLDNLSPDVRPVSEIQYQLVRGQQTENPRFWSVVNVARVDRVAMNSR